MKMFDALIGDWIASNVDDIEDPDILRVYGQEETSTVQTLASYQFEVLLSIIFFLKFLSLLLQLIEVRENSVCFF